MTFIGESKKTGTTIEFEADSSYEAMHWIINHCDMSQEPWEYYEKEKAE